ncbi:baculoviral IAP repeat-containing protein 5a [Gadus chalcogrammus]|uniref:baculoviral IAP repeat-containing protein 5a n=1 Tax=Gadus chalcogrammus TaxID=1042646 RepID=UPI0024C49C71|nr:baculoviral IAP repeat-containing protein 5a [Gadus chalcogrammus]
MMDQEEYKMYFLENRLKTFMGWPFEEGCACTPEKMARAGFLHTPSDNCPDVAKCFFCLKELEGWEPEDDPAAEHRSHSSKCPFINLKKEVEALSVEEFLKLEKERDKYINNKVTGEAVSKFEEGAKLIRAAMKSASGDK